MSGKRFTGEKFGNTEKASLDYLNPIIVFDQSFKKNGVIFDGVKDRYCYFFPCGIVSVNIGERRQLFVCYL